MLGENTLNVAVLVIYLLISHISNHAMKSNHDQLWIVQSAG